MPVFRPKLANILVPAAIALGSGGFCLMSLWAVTSTGFHAGDRQVMLCMFVPLALLLAAGFVFGLRISWDALAEYQIDSEGLTRRVLLFRRRLLWRSLSDFSTTRSNLIGAVWTLTDRTGTRVRILTGLPERGYALDSYIDAFVTPLRDQKRSIQIDGARVFRYGPAAGVALTLCSLLFFGMIVAAFLGSRVQPGPEWPTLLALCSVVFGGFGLATVAIGLRTATYTLRFTSDSIVESTLFHRKIIRFDQVKAFHSREIPLKDGQTQTVSEITGLDGKRITFSEILPDYGLLVSVLRDRVGEPALKQGKEEKQVATRRWSRQQAKVLMVLVPIMCLLLLLMTGWGLRDGLERLQFHQRLDREGVRATARITKRWSQSEGNSGTGYYLDYEFKVNGRTFARSSPVTELNYENASIGSRAPVTYLPSDPSVSRLAASIGARKAWGILGSAGLAVAGAIAFAIMALVSGYRMLKKTAEGESDLEAAGIKR